MPRTCCSDANYSDSILCLAIQCEVWYNVLQYVTMFCNVLPCVALWYHVLQCVAMWRCSQCSRTAKLTVAFCRCSIVVQIRVMHKFAQIYIKLSKLDLLLKKKNFLKLFSIFSPCIILKVQALISWFFIVSWKKHCNAFIRKNLERHNNSIILEALEYWLLISTTQLHEPERRLSKTI